jgi:anionic cell wall polymer biosynthesis LytR-Cps2A-Psr (LCP) family protein
MNGETPAPKKRNWIAIILGVLLLMGILGVGCVVITVSWFRQNMSVTETGEEAAMQQFDDVRKRFPGQEPLIQLVDDKPQIAEARANEAASQTPLKTMHVMAYDTDEGNMVNFSLPFWLVRMRSGPIKISAYQQGWDDRGVSIRIEDIEKHGPGIIVDATRPGEGRVLVWAE